MSLHLCPPTGSLGAGLQASQSQPPTLKRTKKGLRAVVPALRPQDAGLVRCWCGVTLFLCGLEADGWHQQLTFDQTQRRIFEQCRCLIEQVAFAQFFIFAVLAQEQEDPAITRLLSARRFWSGFPGFGYGWLFVY